MRIKDRVRKLERYEKKKIEIPIIIYVEIDRVNDRMTIKGDNINFEGTIAEGEAFKSKIEQNSICVIVDDI